MMNFVELVIPIDRDWLLMLDRVALSVTQILPPGTPYFFTNDQGKVMRLRLEELSFETHKDEVYAFLISEMQSPQKIKIYKQIFALEEARYGKVNNTELHTDMFYAASRLVVNALEEAENIDAYENRMPYTVIAIHYLFRKLDPSDIPLICELYIRHWMYFNEQQNYSKLLNYFEETYTEEVESLRTLLNALEGNQRLLSLFEPWDMACSQLVSQFSSLEVIAESSSRDKSYFYKENPLDHPRKWEVIADHIHLLFNRFGIENEDETLLVYLTLRAMAKF